MSYLSPTCQVSLVSLAEETFSGSEDMTIDQPKTAFSGQGV